jgi:hypothetical protein
MSGDFRNKYPLLQSLRDMGIGNPIGAVCEELNRIKDDYEVIPALNKGIWDYFLVLPSTRKMRKRIYEDEWCLVLFEDKGDEEHENYPTCFCGYFPNENSAIDLGEKYCKSASNLRDFLNDSSKILSLIRRLHKMEGKNLMGQKMLESRNIKQVISV